MADEFRFDRSYQLISDSVAQSILNNREFYNEKVGEGMSLAIVPCDGEKIALSETQHKDTFDIHSYPMCLPDLDKLPPVPPEIISGLLHKGFKMEITGPAKIGKSYFMLDLAVSLAHGKKFLGIFPCTASKVLYLNYEVNETLFVRRVYDVCKAIGIAENGINKQNLPVWTMHPGQGIITADSDTSNFAYHLADCVRKNKVDVVIVDPLYKAFAGSENDQQDAAKFCAGLDIIRDAGATVIYSHHFSKGGVDRSSSGDRGSGSNVFRRDYDAGITLSPLQRNDEFDTAHPNCKPVLIEFETRNNATPNDLPVYFEYPLFRADPKGTTATLSRQTSQSFGGKRTGEQRHSASLNNIEECRNYLDKELANDNLVLVTSIAKQFGISINTARTRIRSAGYDYKDGTVIKRK